MRSEAVVKMQFMEHHNLATKKFENFNKLILYLNSTLENLLLEVRSKMMTHFHFVPTQVWFYFGNLQVHDLLAAHVSCFHSSYQVWHGDPH